MFASEGMNSFTFLCVLLDVQPGPAELVDGEGWEGITNLTVFVDRAVKYLLSLKVDGEEDAGSQVLSYNSNTSAFAEVLQECEKMQVKGALLCVCMKHRHCTALTHSTHAVFGFFNCRILLVMS